MKVGLEVFPQFDDTHRGDIVWVILDRRIGHEQSDRRPAIVLSRRQLTEHTRLTVICSIALKVKGLPFELRIKTKKLMEQYSRFMCGALKL